MNFIKSFFASVLGTITAFILVFVFLLLIISGMASAFQTSTLTKSIKSKSILKLDLNREIADRAPDFNQIEVILEINEEVADLHQLLSAISTAANHPDIEGIVLRTDFIGGGWTQTRELRNALKAFKNSGKFIYAYGDFLSQKGYYIASVADSIYLNPAGMMEFKGLASEVLYYKDFQDQYGLKMEVIRHGKYKSAVEPFLEKTMSEANRYQIQTLLKSLWETILDEIAASRNIDPALLDEFAASASIAVPQDALQMKLIDQLGYEQDIESHIKNLINIDEDDKLSYVSPSTLNKNKPIYNAEIKDRIAVVYAQGPILYGSGSDSFIAQGEFTKAFETLAKDDWIKAIVLRIDSPGGSSLTSELLWQAIEKTKAKKPVIVSMGNVAASGGYYIAAGANQIFVDPLTITGSIGVFATLPNASTFFNKIGIRAQQVETHPNAMGYSPFSPLSDAFKTQMQKGIETTYSLFKKRVQMGRSLNAEQVENIAQGRVWSGKEAVMVGLADRIGGLQDAIAAAAETVGIENYNVVDYPKFENGFEEIFGGFSTLISHRDPILKLLPKNTFYYFEQLHKTTPTPSLHMLLPFELNIR